MPSYSPRIFSPRNLRLQFNLSALALAGLLLPAAANAQVSFNGVQMTLGSGLNNPAAIAVDGSGNLYVADPADNSVSEIVAAGGYTMVNVLGSDFKSPAGVTVDASGNVYVADSGNNAVKEILAAGGYTTVNTLASGFNSPPAQPNRDWSKPGR